MNSVVLIGRLTRDPELSYTPNTQTPVCKFQLAVDRPKKNGEDRGADFIRILIYGKVAEICDKYLSKGRQAAVEGRITTGSYKNRDGQTVYTTDVVAERVEFLGGSQQNNQGGNNQNAGQANAPQQAPRQSVLDPPQGMSPYDGFADLPDTFQMAEDDIPF